jgi:anti-anti-sigma factor
VPVSTKQPFSLIAVDGALVVSGEIDLASADDFLDAAVSMADPNGEVVLDVSGLAFIDSVGLRAILTLALEACPNGVVIQSPGDSLLRLIGMAELERYVGIRVEHPPTGN